MLKPVLISAVLLSALVASPRPSQAGFNPPYVSSYLYSGTLDGCIKAAKIALVKNGYEVQQVIPFNDGKGSDIYASHRDLALGATIECDPANGRGSFAVAGPNAKDAFESFKRLAKESW